MQSKIYSILDNLLETRIQENFQIGYELPETLHTAETEISIILGKHISIYVTDYNFKATVFDANGKELYSRTNLDREYKNV